jgi:excisionase family DNA binding protein
MDTPRSDRLLTTAELALVLGVSIATIHRMRRCGEIPVIRVRDSMYRFDVAEVLAVLRSRNP